MSTHRAPVALPGSGHVSAIGDSRGDQMMPQATAVEELRAQVNVALHELQEINSAVQEPEFDSGDMNHISVELQQVQHYCEGASSIAANMAHDLEQEEQDEEDEEFED